MDSKIKKDILVTGGLGYIGSHTVVEMLSSEYLSSVNVEDEYGITIIDNCYNSSEKILERIKILVPGKEKQITFFKVNILDYERLEDIFKQKNFYAVIHFAGLKSVNESVREPLLYYKNNVGGTFNLVELCLKYKVHNFIFSSSCTVYGDKCLGATEEEIDLRPINSYGMSKLHIEHLLKDVSKAKPEFKSVILRYCNPVAAHKTGQIGENPVGIPANLFPVVERHVRGKTESIKIFGNDYNTKDGTAIRDYVHVVDIAKGHVLALKCFNESNRHFFTNSSAIYNMGTNSGYSVLDVITTYIEVSKINIKYEFTDKREGDVESAVPNSDKIAKDLGWKPLTNLKEMCEDSFNFILKNPESI